MGWSKMILEDDVTKRFGGSQWRYSRSRVDGVHETESSVRIEIDLPGVDADRITVGVEGSRIAVRVDRGVTFIGDEDTLYMIDDRFSGFERSFALPSSVDVAGARSFFSRDTLTIVVPKRPARRTIPVEVRSTVK